LRPESELSANSVLAPLLQSDNSRDTGKLFLPSFQLTSANRLVFQFSMDFHREANCKEVFIDNTRESIDPDSTIDISGFSHYTALPNLALFANAGFPFTRYADLAETGIVLEDTSDKGALEELFFVLGRMGRETGAVGLSFRLMDEKEAVKAKDVDLLLLGGRPSSDLLDHWSADLPLAIGRLGRNLRQLAPAAPSSAGLQLSVISDAAAAPSVQLNTDGALAAFLSFESPVSRGRTVVAWVGNDTTAAQSLIETLDDGTKVPLVRGALAVVRNNSVESFDAERTYYTGSLPFWHWLWFHLARHAFLLILVSLITAVAVGLLLYGGLQRLRTQRLEGQP
jgi:cellulose synthase operon protein B